MNRAKLLTRSDLAAFRRRSPVIKGASGEATAWFLLGHIEELEQLLGQWRDYVTGRNDLTDADLVEQTNYALGEE